MNAAKQSPLPRKLRFALIGTGNFAPWFARYLNEVGELVAICDPSESARSRFFAAAQLEVPGYASNERMFADRAIDAVAISGPNHMHKEAVMAAARAGKHVFCEKMMALTVPDCWEMVRACEAAGVRLMVGHKRRLRPPWARMIELRKDLGEVAVISLMGYFDARPEEFKGWWVDEGLSGGLLALSGVHELDWMRAMCGDVQALSAVSGPAIDSRYNFPDSIHVSLKFHSGAIGSLAVSLSYPLLRYRQVCGAEVVTRRGGMRLVTSFQQADLSWQGAEENQAHHERFEQPGGDPVGVHEAFRKELGDFVRWIVDDAEPCLSGSSPPVRQPIRSLDAAASLS